MRYTARSRRGIASEWSKWRAARNTALRRRSQSFSVRLEKTDISIVFFLDTRFASAGRGGRIAGEPTTGALDLAAFDVSGHFTADDVAGCRQSDNLIAQIIERNTQQFGHIDVELLAVVAQKSQNRFGHLTLPYKCLYQSTKLTVCASELILANERTATSRQAVESLAVDGTFRSVLAQRIKNPVR